MSKHKLLLDHDDLLVIQTELALAVGLNEAIVLQQLHYWNEINSKGRKEATHYRDGKWWVYNTWGDWHKTDFPFWSARTIKRNFDSLAERGLIYIERHENNQKGHWVALNYDALHGLAPEHLSRAAHDKLSPLKVATHDNLSGGGCQFVTPTGNTETTTENTYTDTFPASADESVLPDIATNGNDVSDGDDVTSLKALFIANGGMTASAEDSKELDAIVELYGGDITRAAIDALKNSARLTAASVRAKASALEEAALKPWITALYKHRPARAVNKRKPAYVDAARECHKTVGLCIDDIPGLWQYVDAKAKEGNWPEYSVDALASRVGQYAESLKAAAKRKAAQEERAALVQADSDDDSWSASILNKADVYADIYNSEAAS